MSANEILRAQKQKKVKMLNIYGIEQFLGIKLPLWLTSLFVYNDSWERINISLSI